MKVTFNKVNDTKLERKIKLENIFKKNKDFFVFYSWGTENEYYYEDIRDLHLLCLSISLDLLRNTFKTNEIGNIKYDNYIENETAISEIQKLGNMIKKDKEDNPYKYHRKNIKK